MAYTPDQARCATWEEVPVTITVTGTTARSSALAPGLYEITCDVDCFYLQGGSGVNATTGSIPLWSKNSKLIHVQVTTENGYVAAIRASSSGTMYITRPKD